MLHNIKGSIMAFMIIMMLTVLTISCNIDGSGIFVTISKTTEIADGGFATEPVKAIITKIGNYLYIQHRSSLKTSIVQDSVAVSWANITSLTDPISDVVYDGSDFIYTTIDPVTEKYALKRVTISGGAVTSGPTSLGSGYDQIELVNAQGSDDWFAVTYDTTADTITVFEPTMTTSVISLSSLIPFREVLAFKNDIDDRYYFVFMIHDYTGTSNLDLALTDGFDTVIASTDGSTDDDDEVVITPVSLAWDFDDDVATVTYSGIVSVFYDGPNDLIYIAGDQGQLISVDVSTGGNLFDHTEYTELYDPSTNPMALTYDSSGNSMMVPSIPMLITQRSGKQILLIGGYSRLYEYNITDATIPTTVSTDSDQFYNNISSTRVLDFYDYGVGDFDFYTATADKWIWNISEEGVPSSQIL